jgi:glycosyltransferase involved in cell wall biosynthesis
VEIQPSFASDPPTPTLSIAMPSRTRKAILFIHDYPPISGGGLARHVIDTAELLGLAYDCSIVTSRVKDHFADDSNTASSYEKIQIQHLSLLGIFRLLLSLNKFDALVVNCTYSLKRFTVLSLLLNKYIMKRTIFVLHTDREHIRYNRFSFFHPVVASVLVKLHDWIVTRGAACVTFSDEQRQRLESSGVKNALCLPMFIKIDERHENAFKVRLLKKNGVGKTVGFAGEFSAIKGADRLPALRRYLPKSINMKLCGEGPLRKKLVQYERELHCHSYGLFEVIEFVNPDLMFRFFTSIDLLIVPSRTETLCRTAVEAMACGVPVVAAPVGGLKQLVSAAFGEDHLVNFDQAEVAAKVISNMMDYDDIMRRKGARARGWVIDNYNKYSSGWIKLVSDVVEGRNIP